MVYSNFKTTYTLEHRKQVSENIRRKYPDRVPVICEKAPGSTQIVTLTKIKYLVPGDLTLGEFIYALRNNIEILPADSIFIFIDNQLPPASKLFSELYDRKKDEDGFLYFTYSGENTFG